MRPLKRRKNAILEGSILFIFFLKKLVSYNHTWIAFLSIITKQCDYLRPLTVKLKLTFDIKENLNSTKF